MDRRRLKLAAKYLLIAGAMLLAIFYFGWPKGFDAMVYILGLGVLSNRIRSLSSLGKSAFILVAFGGSILLQKSWDLVPHIAGSLVLAMGVILVEVDNDFLPSKQTSEA